MTSDVAYLHIYTDEGGVTRWEDLDMATTSVEFAPPAPPTHATAPAPATSVVFLRFPRGWTEPWHPAPARQFVLLLTGEIVGSVGEESRQFGPGTVILMEDTDGPGHGLTTLTDVTMAVVRL
jgi:hypothetical protein